MKDYDEATAFLGQWGRFQQVVFFLLCVSIVPDGLVFSVVFLTDTPKHHCLVPEVNLTQDWLDAIIPVEVVGFSVLHRKDGFLAKRNVKLLYVLRW